MKISCDIIRDLIYSYVNNLSSDATNDLINEHIKECDSCNSVLNKLKLGAQPQDIKERLEDKASVKLFRRIRNRIFLKSVLTIFAVIILLLSLYLTYTFFTTCAPTSDSISRDIEKRTKAQAQIIEIIPSKTELFVLFRFKTNNSLGMIYYSRHALIKNRYVFSGGAFSNGDSTEKYDIYDFTSGVNKGVDRLIVVFGDNKGINADKFELDVGSSTKITEDISHKNYFMSVYRFWQQEPTGNLIRFSDKNNKDITDKFYK